jgi:hypothetical protein
MSPDSINALKEAIHTAHGCDSEHIESVALIEQSEGKIPWYGTVEVFRLIAHPKAERACAWSYCTGANQTRCFTVLEFRLWIPRRLPSKRQLHRKPNAA